VALSPPPSHATTTIQTGFDGLSAMSEFASPDHLAGGIIDDGQSCRLASWVNLEAERIQHGVFYHHVQDDREGISFEDGSFARREQKACSSRMNGI